MRLLLPLIAVLLLATCGRPLTEAERGFAALLHGPSLNTDTVRLHRGLAPEPLRTVPVRPRLACRDRIWPQPEGPTVRTTTSAMAIFQSVHFRDRWYRDDFLAEFPDVLPLVDAMLFAHEMVHVWQWQNRDLTGYHPLRAAFEHLGSPDPYQFDTGTAAAFLDYGYEQQGAIMEEYVCCRALAPDAARTKRLAAMLAPYFTLPPQDRPLASQGILLPWRGVEIAGICD